MRGRFLLILGLAAAATAGDERGFLGFQPSFRAKPEKGIAIEYVFPDGPAGKAGLKPGDVVLKYNGHDAPNAKDHDDETLSVAFLKIAEQVKAGAEVEILVLREGQQVTLKALAISAAEMNRLVPQKEEDEGPGEKEEVKLPDLASAGDPAAATFDFQKFPEGFFPIVGQWKVMAEAGTDNGILRQDKPVQPWALSLFAGKGLRYADATATVRFQPISGEEDASGGIIFRAQDARNYYFVRGNALESNLRMYLIKDGVRTQLASVTVEPPALRKWHTLEVSFVGATFKAKLDGKDVVEATDATFKSGWCGLWTKADSVTLFDDLAIKPEKAVGH